MAATMAPVTITYQKPGTKPPIYVAGTFSDPAWQPQEMEYHVNSDGEYVFKKDLQGKPGSKIQYKFRIGDGNWWVLNNDDTPTVTDMAGNKNNELEIPPPKEISKQEGAENGDAVLPATGPGEGGLQPINNVVKEIQSLSHSNSGADTPTLAMNAAEVADSAALLDEEEPEAEISDEEAGRVGLRRLSATPIIEVANTAAEVADSAQELDNTPEVVIQSYPPDLYDFRDDDETDKPPLFAHECVGMENVEEILHQEDHTEEDAHVPTHAAEDVDLDNIDLNDPTLERFPSDREEIINTVRKLETGLGEDRVSFEGAPISPVVAAYRPGMEDITGDPFLSSPIVASPVIPRPSRHLDVPRSPRGSMSSNHSSPLSLHAIDEGDEPGATDEPNSAGPVLLSPPKPRSGLRSPKRPSDDEDEGIAIKDDGSSGTSTPEPGQGESKPAESPRDNISRALQEESPDIEASSRQAEPQHSLTTSQSSPDHHEPETPGTVIETAEDSQVDNPAVGKRQGGSTEPDTHASNSGPVVDVGTTTAVEVGEGQVRKRTDVVDRSATPVSTHSVTLHPNREGGWFKNFFRLLFVEWIGGFISRLCGRRRQTLLTAGAAAVFMGLSWWKIYGDGPRKPHGSA